MRTVLLDGKYTPGPVVDDFDPTFSKNVTECDSAKKKTYQALSRFDPGKLFLVLA